jgi:broad specificity phosphatase PhoE
MNPNPEQWTRLLLVRHGESVGNLQDVWAGWSETPLSAVGRRQAADTAARLAQEGLGAVALFSSPLSRAWQTADVIGRALGHEPIVDESLKEMHFGDLECMQGRRFAEDHPTVYARWRDKTDEDFGWPGGETRRQFRRRVSEAIARLAGACNQQTALVVTHSGVIRMALAHLIPERFGAWWDVRVDNCSLTHVELGGSCRVRVPVVNDVGHLRQ